jgi:hypothetical protein
MKRTLTLGYAKVDIEYPFASMKDARDWTQNAIRAIRKARDEAVNQQLLPMGYSCNYEIEQAISYCKSRTYNPAITALLRTRAESKDGSAFGAEPPIPLIQRMRSLPLDPQAFKYDRAIGIEIECFGPSIEVPYWARQETDGSVRWTGDRNDENHAKGLYDPREYRFLVRRSTLEVKLDRIAKVLSGHRVNKTCGLHLHLDMRGRSMEDVLKIAKKANKWLFALRTFVPESRRDNTYCKWGISRNDRYRAVNVCSFDRHQTLEFRLHSGTTDYTKILSWVRLVELICALKASPKGEGIEALAGLPLCDYERAYWLKRHQQLNPGLYDTAATTNEIE